MDNKPLISVIIPTFNREKTLLRSITSVLNQTYLRLEVIIVDDCSTDGSIEIIKSISDSRLNYYINDVNRGACFSRNRGITLSHGDYIAFQDSDDFWYPEKIEKQLRVLESFGVEIVYCNMRKVNNKGNRISIFPKEKLIYSQSLYHQFLFHNKSGTQTLLIKKECLLNDFFDENLPRFQEWDLMIRLSKKFRIYHLDEILVDYYLQGDSISNNYNKGLVAIQSIYAKYIEDIILSKEIHFVYLSTIAQYQLAANNLHETKHTLLKALSVKFNLKILVKYILLVMGLSSILRKRWDFIDK